MQPRRVKTDEDRYNRRTEDATRRMIRATGQPIDTLGQSAAAAIQFEANRRTAGDQAETAARQQADQMLSGWLDIVRDQSSAAVTAETASRTAADNALGSRIDTLGTSTAAALNAEATTRAATDTAEATARGDADKLRPMVYGADGKALQNPRQYAHTLPVAGSQGQAVFYLTDTGTASGTPLFTSIRTVQPQVNDGTTVYGFGWVISADMKTLTVTVRKSATPVLSLLGINILGAPAIAPAGTLVNVFVAGL